jgi:aspartyl protease family protein
MLRSVILFLSIAGGTAALASQVLNFATRPESPSAMTASAPKAAPVPKQTTSGYRTVTLRDDGRGHFQVEANVDGRRMDFLVDTGASVVALREGSAARLGIFPKASDYTAKIQTANGTGKAARVTLNRIDINGITVRDVRAIVVPDDQLAVNLLGMSFLSGVKWSHDRGKLVLEQ